MIHPNHFGKDKSAIILVDYIKKEHPVVLKKISRILGEFRFILKQLVLIQDINTKKRAAVFFFHEQLEVLSRTKVADRKTLNHALSTFKTAYKEWLRENKLGGLRSKRDIKYAQRHGHTFRHPYARNPDLEQ
jgi:hypothetical protein